MKISTTINKTSTTFGQNGVSYDMATITGKKKTKIIYPQESDFFNILYLSLRQFSSNISTTKYHCSKILLKGALMQI